MLRINLGAGSVIEPGWVNHDLVPLPGIDVAHDLDTYPWPWDDGIADRVKAYDVFEHVWHPYPFIRECWRILRAGGVLDIHTVHYKSPNYHRDPDHKRACDPNSMDYWVKGTYLNGRYGAGAAQGCVFEHVQQPALVDGMELAFLLRKLPKEVP